MMRIWFQSQLNRSVQLYVELGLYPAADGMPTPLPVAKLLGFLNTRQNAVDMACVYIPEPVQLELGKTATLWQAKQAIENATKTL